METKQKRKKLTTALEYYDEHLFYLNLKLDKDEITTEEYLEARQKLYYKCKLFERKQIVKASFVNYWQGKIHSDGGDVEYKGAQDYYNKTYGILEPNGSHRK